MLHSHAINTRTRQHEVVAVLRMVLKHGRDPGSVRPAVV